MSVYVTGDVHGHHDIRKFNSKNWKDGKELTKDDYVIVTGDFGLIWDVNESRESETHWLKWLSEKPWTTLFCDGNHENFDRLLAMSEVEMFGGTVGKITDSIFHLKRGQIYTIENNAYFVMGGARSEDKIHRAEKISWWSEELPSFTDYKRGTDSLEAVDYKVDYVITHAPPETILRRIPFMKYGPGFQAYDFLRYLDTIREQMEFKKWFFGHLHHDGKIGDKFHGMYHKIVKI